MSLNRLTRMVEGVAVGITPQVGISQRSMRLREESRRSCESEGRYVEVQSIARTRHRRGFRVPLLSFD